MARCFPGAVAYVVSMPAPLREANGRVVMLKHSPPTFDDGEWVWGLVQPLEVVLREACRQGGLGYSAGETVLVERLQERFLRPITPPPGADTETVEQVLEAARNEPAEV